MKSKAQLKIGELVNVLGIPASTLRYYEKVSLIKPVARVANSRCYDQDAIVQLRFIQMAQAVGFSITEIKQLLAVFSVNKTEEPDSCGSLVEAKLDEIQKKISDLQKMQLALEAIMESDCNCVSLKDCVEMGDEVKNQLVLESET